MPIIKDMKKLLIVADYNDADYVKDVIKVEDSVFEKFLPFMKAINNFEPYVRRNRFGGICEHNWISSREDLGEKNIYETYPQFTPEYIDEFIDIFTSGLYIPYDDCNCHTIVEISDIVTGEKYVDWEQDWKSCEKRYSPIGKIINNMTTEEKLLQLLLTDLCARLPYDTIVSVDNGKFREDTKLRPYHLADFNTWGIRPYLRPINTITKSEIADAIKYICDTDNVVWDNGTRGVGVYFYKSDGIKRPFDDFKFKLGCYGPKNIDWFNKFHFDYRGLIPMGLALPAPEGMYN